MSHLVQRAGAQIVSWPIFELSLTEHPAEPLTMSLQQVKSLQLLDWRIRDIQRQMIVHQCWENVGRFRDPETKRWFELLADIIELEGEIERDKRMADLQRAGRLTKRLRELEAQ